MHCYKSTHIFTAHARCTLGCATASFSGKHRSLHAPISPEQLDLYGKSNHTYAHTPRTHIHSYTHIHAQKHTYTHIHTHRHTYTHTTTIAGSGSRCWCCSRQSSTTTSGSCVGPLFSLSFPLLLMPLSVVFLLLLLNPPFPFRSVLLPYLLLLLQQLLLLTSRTRAIH